MATDVSWTLVEHCYACTIAAENTVVTCPSHWDRLNCRNIVDKTVQGYNSHTGTALKLNAEIQLKKILVFCLK